jgi:hypothetical protein
MKLALTDCTVRLGELWHFEGLTYEVDCFVLYFHSKICNVLEKCK